MENPFNNYYKEYDEWFDKNLDIYKNELEFVGRYIDEESISLEIGAGTGRFGIPLGIKYGIEPSKNMAAIAYNNGMRIIVGRAEDLPVKKNYFELVLLNTVLCFIRDTQKAIENIYTILKKQGKVVVFLIDRDSPIGKKYEAKKDKNKFYRYANFLNKTQVENVFKKNGFVLETEETYRYKVIDGLKLMIFKKD